MKYEEAIEIYSTAVDTGEGSALQPIEALSEFSHGRWVLKNDDGFLAYVTVAGKVLDHQLHEIGPVSD